MKKIIIFVCMLAFLSSCVVRYTPMQQSWQPKDYKKSSNKTPRAYRR